MFAREGMKVQTLVHDRPFPRDFRRLFAGIRSGVRCARVLFLWRNVSTELLVIFIALVVLPTAILGVLLMRSSQNAARVSSLRDQREIAVRTAGEIALLVGEPLKILAATGDAIGLTYPDPWRQESILVKLSLRSPIFEYIYFTDEKGREVATSSVDSGKKRMDRSEDVAFQKAIHGECFISQVYISENRTPFVDIALAVKRLGKTIGVLGARVSLRGLWHMADNIKIGETGQVYVISGQGRLIACPDKKLVLKGEGYGERHILAALQTGETGSYEYIAQAGERWLSAYAPIPDLGWGIVVQRSSEEVYRFAEAMRAKSAFLILVSTVIAFAVGLIITRSVVKPIQQLREGTRRITRGDLSHQIEVGGRNEIAGLATSFNRMTSSLFQTQSALEAARDFSEKIVQNAPIGIFTINEDGCVTSSNSAFAKILDIDQEGDILGETVDTIPAFKEAKFRALLTQGLRGTSFEAIPLSVRSSDGEYKDIMVRGVPLKRSEDDWIEGLLVLVEDVTEQRRMEHRLVQSEKLAGLGQLAAGIAHELRNPLSIIKSAAYVLKGLPDKSEKTNLCLEKIQNGMTRSERIISNLLDFSRPATQEIEEVDVVKVLEQVLLLVGKNISNQDIEVRTDFEEIPWVRINLDAVRQVFLNLVSNAVQAMPNGGRLELSASRLGSREVIVKISDTGMGIKEEHLPSIFNPFFTTKEPGKGTGLGLFLVYREIERYGGSIKVQSEEGQGTTFFVTLPGGQE